MYAYGMENDTPILKGFANLDKETLKRYASKGGKAQRTGPRGFAAVDKETLSKWGRKGGLLRGKQRRERKGRRMEANL